MVLFGGSICYVEDPYKYLFEAVNIGAEYIIFDRTPITPGQQDVFAVQNVSASIYEASSPIRSFSYQNLNRIIGAKYDLVERWVCDLQPDPRSTAMGFCFKYKAEN